MKKKPQAIVLKGVKQNNLKDFDLSIPIGKLTVVTGVSGSGKSSLVFETLHAEGQRRYVETFSAYTRQFLEMMDRPKIDSVENIRPSIAIEQSNSVKTSRSTVGTMTELCDYFKIWFCHVSGLYDPDTGKKIESDSPQSVWKKVFKGEKLSEVLIGFTIHKPKNLSWDEITGPLLKKGYVRVIANKKIVRIEELKTRAASIVVIQDRLVIQKENEARFVEAVTAAMHFGGGQVSILDIEGVELSKFSGGLHSPETGKVFEKAQPATFSFNSPIGACPKCRGFGKTIDIDYNLVIPDHNLSIENGAIRVFKGAVYGESLEELLRYAKKAKVPTNIPWKDLSDGQKHWVINGDPEFLKDRRSWNKNWYGVKPFFEWLESKSYKMHVRFILAKFRKYQNCEECHGTRLKPGALNWKWLNYTLPDLYQLSVDDLLALVKKETKTTGNHPVDLAAEAIISRLSYLSQVGLGYLTLDRPSKTLSGGEVERVNLTTCIGTSLVDTLFVLDEPSIGLHSRDINRLIAILRRLTDLGNTVVVVEHDETIMRAADHIVEIGPEPGSKGGQVVFSGSIEKLEKKSAGGITGAFLRGEADIALPLRRRSLVRKKQPSRLEFKGVTMNNIRNIDVSIPMHQFVCLTGVSGSGKSTLLNNVIHQGLEDFHGKGTEDLAKIKEISSNSYIPRSIFVDQSPITRTPRSNPALYIDAWDSIRELFSRGLMGKAADMRPSHFSFNSGQGRCDHCHGLGYEKVEMQFLSDVFVTCPVCDGKRFKDEVLGITWNHKNVWEVLEMDVNEAVEFFRYYPKVTGKLAMLQEVGLGYLKLGQPLNTLSGGESQRLKLMKHVVDISSSEEKSILLLDEPTTGLHRNDIKLLISVFQKIVNKGHSLLIIEHQLDVIKSADWIIELGPEAGQHGGKIVAAGTPEQIVRSKTQSAPFLAEALHTTGHFKKLVQSPLPSPEASFSANAVELVGAREHNLKNISVSIPHNAITVVTGVSGSGKSTLAFDIIFAEGQRRFMESISAYARQFIEQMARPDIDKLTGIPPTVAIEQRVTRGTGKSTVATVTEAAQYLRLLYAKVGTQFSPKSEKPVVAMALSALTKKLQDLIAANKQMDHLYLATPLVVARKGHHEPIATWAESQGFQLLKIDGKLIKVQDFKKLDRYKEHDIDLITRDLKVGQLTLKLLTDELSAALNLGNGYCLVLDGSGNPISYFSTKRSDPITGESFPELDPKHFSWNSPRGWCVTCHGHGVLMDWMLQTEDYKNLPKKGFESGSVCPDCCGDRLSLISRSVKIDSSSHGWLSLPQVLKLTPSEVVLFLHSMTLDKKGHEITRDLLPQITERLAFMDQVGLNYLSLDRSSSTLSGGEAQRIRLASQLSSNLSGVLYVLDEPSIGLHARDSERLIESLKNLKNRGNTLLVVEHDEDTMRAADYIIDIGPDAGIHGGEILASGNFAQISRNKKSLTAQYLNSPMKHPIRGKYRKLPAMCETETILEHHDWLALTDVHFRNIKHQDLFLPIGKLSVVCGISGSGKSTLVRDVLKLATQKAIELNANKVLGVEANLEFGQILNGNLFKKVIEVDQEPIGQTTRSTPITYIGAFDIIRDIYATLPEAKLNGFTKSHFSFNTTSGHCQSCKGTGSIKLEMNFLPDTFVTCQACHGNRYGSELSEVRWNEKNIWELLDLSFNEALEFFAFHKRLQGLMQLMVQTGLGYLKLGQPSPSLSGGEAQRLKLVTELAKGLPTFKEMKRGTSSSNLYILEEPTIGLHLKDCERLINILHQLTDQGHTVVVIEHHLDIIAEADYLIEVGPEGGIHGGEILFQGQTHDILKAKRSQTAKYLKSKL